MLDNLAYLETFAIVFYMLPIFLLLLASLIAALWAINKQHGSKKPYFILAFLYVLMILNIYENTRAGIAADQQGLSGCSVNLLGCWGVPIMFVLFGLTLAYQIGLIIIYFQKTRNPA